jgi:hypothetical protein
MEVLNRVTSSGDKHRTVDKALTRASLSFDSKNFIMIFFTYLNGKHREIGKFEAGHRWRCTRMLTLNSDFLDDEHDQDDVILP